MEENQQVTKEPEKPWSETERVRPPWIKTEYPRGEHVLPPNEQASNLSLSDKEVMGRRTDPVTESMATPIGGRHDTGHGASDEPSGRKQI